MDLAARLGKDRRNPQQPLTSDNFTIYLFLRERAPGNFRHDIYHFRVN